MPQEQGHHNQAIWIPDIREDPMSANVEDEDFAKFLDLDTDFHFTGLDNGSSGLDTPMGRLGLAQHTLQSMQGLTFGNDQSINLDMSSSSHHGDYSATSTPATSHHFEPYQQQYHQMQMGHNYHIPPTPISSEMHAAKYGQRVDANGHLVFDTHQVSFTPLVSPAQTPLTGTFTIAEYGLGEDFFSPLTSPAIEAQGAGNLTGTTASPSDLSIDTTVPKTSVASAKRGRRRGSISGRPAARSVKHSPAMKPQTRRRQPSLSNVPIEKIEAVMKQPVQHRTKQPHLTNMGVQASDDSVSPEPLSETLMRPPPIPLNIDKSPRAPLPLHAPDSANPVTPSTLMKMPSDQRIGLTAAEQAAQAADMIEGQMEDIMLPDAATPSVIRPDLPTLDVSRFSGDDQSSTPTMPARSGKASTASTPRSGDLKSLSQDSVSKSIKVEGKSGRGNKKRPNTTSAAISPALRPKISPSISPLVPATGSGMGHYSAESSTLYLASKSNYQNIIDGTHLPGVTYPEALAENLSSKRTSHKLAEQGRRNRINVALREIESLLPPTIVSAATKKERTKSEEAEDGEKGGSAAAQSTSKASTVEMAITYIKSLQAELEATKSQLQTVEQRLAETSSGAASQTSDEATLDKS